MTLLQTCSSSRSSICTRNRLLWYPANVTIVPHAKAIVAPSGFPDRLTRSAATPVRPALATLQKMREAGRPSQSVNRTRPRSIVRTAEPDAVATARSTFFEISKVFTKSHPEPRGITASSASGLTAASPSKNPFATSDTVPSPPTATISPAPSRSAARVSSDACPAASVARTSRSRPRAAAARAISGQRRAVRPLSDAGFTTMTPVAVRLMVVHRGRQRQPGHPLDCCRELLVADPHELLAADEVRDDQDARGRDAAERGDREEHRCLHLDGEDAARRPAA